MRRRLFGVVGLAILMTGVIAGQGNRGQGNRGATGPCDRACLEGFVEQYLDAWVARDPKKLPLAANAKYTENGQRLELGDGSWNVATGKGKYRLFVTDTVTGQVGVIATVTEEPNVASMVALRLKVVNRQISEAEALFVRPAAPAGGARGARGGAPAAPAAPPQPSPAERLEALGKPHPLFLEPIPLAERMSREDLIKTADMYFTGMQQNDGKGVYPFADDCQRFENATLTTNVETPPNQTRPNPKTATTYSSQWSCKEQFESGLIHFVTRIRDRRYVAVDPERGLVYSFVFFDHMAGKTRTYQAPDGRTVTGGPTEPWTWEIAELFRLEKGKIRRIEAILVRSPYGQNSGWSSYEDSMSDKARDIR
jgi:hypothetical protein